MQSGRIVERDRHLVRYASGIVYDSKSGLEWLPGPDSKTSWEQARSWIVKLVKNDGSWRMPTRKELDTLHDVGDGIDNITDLLGFSGYWIWAGPPEGPPRKWLFSFSYGGEGWNGQPPPDGGRVLAVRRR